MSLTIDNSNKLTGMASGLNTDSIITGLVSSYQTKIDKVSQEKTKDEWIQSEYRDVNTLVKNFRTKYMSALSDTNLMSSKIYKAYDTTMLSSSNAVSVKASSTAAAGNMTVDYITKLATAATTSSKSVFTGDSYSTSTTLSELSLSNPLEFDENGRVSFSINDITFTFNGDTTIGDMISEVNDSDAGVTMNYSELNKGFTIKSDSTGESNPVVISNISGNAFSSGNSAFGIAEDTYLGQDAVLSINGTDITESSNTFTYDGITYTLNDTTNSSVKFKVSQNIDEPVQKIKDFISAYNELVDKLQSKVAEKYDSDYPPLTDAQKKEMSDDEVTDWNTKAKTGLLHNDTYINKMLTTLRSSLYDAVESAGMAPSDIGLTTGLYTDGSKITLNETKLRSALESDPDKVTNIFMASGDDSKSQGLIVRISNAFSSYTNDTTDIALDDLDDKVSDLKEKSETLEDEMEDKREKLYLKFSKMEAALSKLNSTSSWLGSFFSSGS